MNGVWKRAAAAIVAAGALGAVVRVGLHAWLGAEMVALAAVNVLGWVLLGLLWGRFGPRVDTLRLALAVLGVTAFTSMVSLITDGVAAAGDVVVALIELVFGLMFAGVGHLITMPRGPDL